MSAALRRAIMQIARQAIVKTSPLSQLRGGVVCALFALALFAASGAVAKPQLISSSSVNGKTVNVYAEGSGSRNADIEQNNDITILKIGPHTIIINPDGRVSVDGKETSYGPFKELNVTFGDGDKIEITVAN
jgi:hypothetical protein